MSWPSFSRGHSGLACRPWEPRQARILKVFDRTYLVWVLLPPAYPGCQRAGSFFIGTEMEQEFAELAWRRIEAAVRWGVLRMLAAPAL
jgi:hypothetical protein